MDPGGRPIRRPETSPTDRIAEIVPARAVLTELARGFLMVQAGDPTRAKEFAATFLKEQAGRSGPGRIVPVSRRPIVRGGPRSPAWDDAALGGGYLGEGGPPEL